MNYAYGLTDILVLPQDLQDFAWSAPMRDLAAKIGLSDVGLKKLLKSHGVISPPQGHWNRVQAGKLVPECPKLPARRPGESGRARIDDRFAKLLLIAEPIPSSGPFASAAVPEDLGELYQQELNAIRRVTVPRKLERIHYGLAQIFKQEERRRAKFAASHWSWDAPKFDSAVDRRRLRILNAVFMGLSRRDQSADVYEHNGEIHARAQIGDMYLGIYIEVVGKHRTVQVQGRARAAPDLPGSTPLALSVDPGFDRKNCTTWQDDAQGTLERKIAEIVARIITMGEEKFRRSLREVEERAEEQRRREETRRQEGIAARNAARLKHLRESGDLLRQAQDLRVLIGRVRDAATAGAVDVDQSRFEEWETWASEEADRLDPILSGQIMTHVKNGANDS